MSMVSVYAGLAGSNFNTSAGGTKTWTNTGNATGAPDAAVAASQTMGTAVVSESLDTYDFNPALPGGATVDGLQVVMTGYCLPTTGGTLGAPKIDSAALMIGGTNGTPTGSNPAGTVLAVGSGASTTYTWGGSTDLWGLSSTLTVANMNSATEGTGPTFSVWFEGNGNTDSKGADIDAVQLTVFYTASGGGGGDNSMGFFMMMMFH